jgi:hypothetical protein
MMDTKQRLKLKRSGAGDWQRAYIGAPFKVGHSRTFARWVSDPAHFGLRDGRKDVNNRGRSNVFYGDEDGSVTYQGQAFRLPNRRGWVAGAVDHNGSVCLDLSTVYPCEREDWADTYEQDAGEDAALEDARWLAEKLAEDARDHEDAWRAGSEAAYLASQQADAWTDVKRAARACLEIRRAGLAPGLIWEQARDHLAGLLEDWQEAKDRHESAVDDAPTYDERLSDAWADGYANGW